jgi:hypothetical protein
MKTTFNGRLPQHIKSGMCQQPLIGSNYIVQIHEMKTTSNLRRPQNIKSGISQQPNIGSYSTFQLEFL